MVTWSIGAANIYSTGDHDPGEFLRVVSDGPDSRISAVIDTGDHASFAMACDQIARLDRDDQLPTPLKIASYVGGGGATLHQVLPDATLRGPQDSDSSDGGGLAGAKPPAP